MIATAEKESSFWVSEFQALGFYSAAEKRALTKTPPIERVTTPAFSIFMGCGICSIQGPDGKGAFVCALFLL